jgi:hypothetical protein
LEGADAPPLRAFRCRCGRHVFFVTAFASPAKTPLGFRLPDGRHARCRLAARPVYGACRMTATVQALRESRYASELQLAACRRRSASSHACRLNRDSRPERCRQPPLVHRSRKATWCRSCCRSTAGEVEDQRTGTRRDVRLPASMPGGPRVTVMPAG